MRQMRRSFLSRWLGFVVWLLASCASDSFWWNQEFGNSRNSSFIDVATGDPVTPKWTYPLFTGPLKDLVPSPPVLTLDGAIIVSGSSEDSSLPGYVKCVDKDGVTLRYERALVASPFNYPDVSTPAVAPDGSVAVIASRVISFANNRESSENLLFYLNPSGNIQWTFQFEDLTPRDSPSSSPRILGKMVFAFAGDGYWAINLVTSKVDKRAERSSIPAVAVAASHDLAIGDPLLFDGFHLSSWNPMAGFTFLRDTGIRGPYPWLGSHLLPVISAQGMFVFFLRLEDASHNLIGHSVRVDPSKLTGPLLEREYEHFTSVPFFSPVSLALGGDRADFTLYLVEHASIPVSITRLIALTGGYYSTTWLSLQDASAPTATKTRVHVSDMDGLHTVTLALGSHVLAPSPGLNRTPRQPAIGRDGSVYDVVTLETIQGRQVILRAFPGPAATQ